MAELSLVQGVKLPAAPGTNPQIVQYSIEQSLWKSLNPSYILVGEEDLPWDEDPAEVVEGADEVTEQRQHGEAERYEEKPIGEF